MEFVDGFELHRYLEREEPPSKQRLRMMIAIARGIQHAHERGVIHLDLTPSNILVTTEGHPKIIDFGIARILDDERAARAGIGDDTAIAGTLAYMSPEQTWMRRADLDNRSDIYTLGVLTFLVLTGELPVAPRGTEPSFKTDPAIGDEPPRRLASVDRTFRGDLDCIVARAMTRDREHRYESAHDFADDLDRSLRRYPVRARPVTRSYRARRFAQRNSGRLAIASVAVIALIGGTVTSTVFAIQSHQSEKRAETARMAERDARIREHRAAAERLRLLGDWQGVRIRTAELIDLLGDETPSEVRMMYLEAIVVTEPEHLSSQITPGIEAAFADHPGIPVFYRAFGFDALVSEGPYAMLEAARAAGVPPAYAAVIDGFLAPSTDEAVAHLRRAVAIDPGLDIARFWMATTRMLRLEPTIARAEVAGWIALQPRNQFVLALALVLSAIDRDQEAFEEYRTRLENVSSGTQLAMAQTMFEGFEAWFDDTTFVDPESGFERVGIMLQSVHEASSLTGSDGRSGYGTTQPRSVVRASEALLRGLNQLPTGDYEAAAAAYRIAYEANPCAITSVLLASVLRQFDPAAALAVLDRETPELMPASLRWLHPLNKAMARSSLIRQGEDHAPALLFRDAMDALRSEQALFTVAPALLQLGHRHGYPAILEGAMEVWRAAPPLDTITASMAAERWIERGDPFVALFYATLGLRSDPGAADLRRLADRSASLVCSDDPTCCELAHRIHPNPGASE